MAKEPGRCIFCGRHGLSKEHIWSEWTHALVPRLPNAAHERVHIASSRIEAEIHQRKKFQGSPNTIRLRKVCKYHCNNGWMSLLDDAAKPLLTPLITGVATTLKADDQHIIAAWLAMKVMVAEFSRPADVSTPQDHRTALMKERKLPPGWKIWIATHSSPWWQTGYHRHGATLGFGRGPVPPKRPSGKNTQSVTLGIGALLAHIIASPSAVKFDIPDEIGRYLIPIWPITSDITWPPPPLSDADVELVATAMERTLLPFMWLP